MDESRKIVLQQSAVVAVGVAVLTGLMLGIYALLGYFDTKVLLSGFLGALLTVANFFFMAVGTALAADRAQEQNVKGGKAIMSGSMGLRLVVLLVALFALLKSGVCTPLPLLLPLLFVRPVLMLAEFFQKKEGRNK